MDYVLAVILCHYVKVGIKFWENYKNSSFSAPVNINMYEEKLLVVVNKADVSLII